MMIGGPERESIIEFNKKGRNLVNEFFLDEDRFEVSGRVGDDVAFIDYNVDTIITKLKGIAHLTQVEQLAHINRLTVFMEKIREDGLPIIPDMFQFILESSNNLIQA